MESLVIELQKDAINENVRTSNLLRKAMVVSSKLGISEIENWIKDETYGYPNQNNVPKYRELKGEIKIKNPYHGLQTLHFDNPNVGEKLSNINLVQSVLELEFLMQGEKNGYLIINFPQSTKNYLMEQVGVEPMLVVNPAQIHKIIESVRNQVLNWALELEKKGILGNGLSFTSEEKNEASKIFYNVTNNINMNNSQLQHNTTNSSQTMELNHNDISEFTYKIKENIQELKKLLNVEDFNIINAEISTLDSQLSSPKPNNNIILESKKSIRSILEGIGGGLVIELLKFLI